jgi:hypothetical protein
LSREPHVPLLLWISAAILAHLVSGGGAERAAQLIEERIELREFVSLVRERLQPPEVIEVSFENVETPAPQEPTWKAPEPKTPEAKKPEKKVLLAEQPPAKKPEPKRHVLVLPPMSLEPPPAPKPPPPLPTFDRRIAVKQHVKPNQPDNPNAHFVGDEANHVAEETVARITAHDRDDLQPQPGGHHAGPDDTPGNSDHDKVGDTDDHPGDPTHAPGESATELDFAHEATPKPARLAMNELPGPVRPLPAEPRREAETPPNVRQPGYHLDPTRRADEAFEPDGEPDRSKLPSGPKAGPPEKMLALGGGKTPRGVNLNLTEKTAIAAIGQDEITRERQADGERRRSAHRGSWKSSGLERWRAAIENYVSSVKPGNQTALNTARVPFATYLVFMHNRIHPIFADDFLGSLDGLPSTHPMNAPNVVTALEIVLSRDDGHVVKMGVTKTSGITAFDIAALDSVQRASPFGKPPAAIVSTDGNVYLHWEFHRDPYFACSNRNARPFLLKLPPATEPAPSEPPRPSFPGSDPRERELPSAPTFGHGLLAPSRPVGDRIARNRIYPGAG